MIPIKTIVDKANTKIAAGGLTDLEYTQLVSTDVFLDRPTPKIVGNFSLLPSAANNKGVMYYVTNQSKYYFSDGTNWRKDFSSDATVANTFAYAWGGNYIGQLGTNGTTSTSSPVTVVGALLWTQISPSSSANGHSLGLTSAGIAYAWGEAASGRLGDRTVVDKSSPVTVVGGITTWIQLSAGAEHSLGLTSAGIAYAWGSATDGANNVGQLGDGTIVAKSSPVTVVGGITTWNQLSGGSFHSLGLTSAGIAYAWGEAAAGRLGDGTTTDKSSPVTVVGGITNWTQLSAGTEHSLGLTSAGIAYAWGEALSGEIGDGTAVDKSSPVTVAGGITTWTQVSAGGFVSFGLSVREEATKGFA